MFLVCCFSLSCLHLIQVKKAVTDIVHIKPCNVYNANGIPSFAKLCKLTTSSKQKESFCWIIIIIIDLSLMSTGNQTFAPSHSNENICITHAMEIRRKSSFFIIPFCFLLSFCFHLPLLAYAPCCILQSHTKAVHPNA